MFSWKYSLTIFFLSLPLYNTDDKVSAFNSLPLCYAYFLLFLNRFNFSFAKKISSTHNQIRTYFASLFILHPVSELSEGKFIFIILRRLLYPRLLPLLNIEPCEFPHFVPFMRANNKRVLQTRYSNTGMSTLFFPLWTSFRKRKQK